MTKREHTPVTPFLDEAQVELGLIELLRGMGDDYAFRPDNGTGMNGTWSINRHEDRRLRH